jgi:outer membrane protein OmpA-like peptidoglycan-associated protein
VRHQFFVGLSIAVALAGGTGSMPQGRATAAQAPAERTDYLTFAQGAVPIAIGGAGAKLGANFEAAVRITDGDPAAFSLVNGAPDSADTEFTYQLPAPTTFDRFAVPNIVETPSPTITFTRTIEVYGSATGASAGYELLASATLQIPKVPGQVTELKMAARRPVRWVRVRLAGGINILRPPSSFQFSEIIGNGSQETPALVTHFTGSWRTQANRLQLVQRGALVSGCYDGTGDLAGTVVGNILKATGTNRFDKTSAQFILSVADNGSIQGVRSSNGGPFRLYTVAASAAAGECKEPSPPTLGCGSIIHGIAFGFDSADIRPESAPVLEELFKGLQADKSARILIEGHTSSEGTDEYNQRLSERRAQSVVADLVRRGLARDRLSAAGIGERRPIATNDNESGRSMNRRVEVKCQ